MTDTTLAGITKSIVKQVCLMRWFECGAMMVELIPKVSVCNLVKFESCCVESCGNSWRENYLSIRVTFEETLFLTRHLFAKGNGPGDVAQGSFKQWGCPMRDMPRIFIVTLFYGPGTSNACNGGSELSTPLFDSMEA
ncbi:uncharacterized protein MELLADRAFT_114484 [Melampsora larici-populina 98AG31]|uniref:Uncharacterized protein n=1 Tax=Melampsora larici-populina (strain 98AG31 / pathotype 3-4-7) TaxID=747676 RepID=F4SDM6_MELLP|nr:uncharacterized protein MELLADRAFT_114484 [Melampsora larici-populina 98AG31]EGF97251.1 hypothetical protein MELLADRAFT_114484 [Melampsora larici-populina 98AG31]